MGPKYTPLNTQSLLENLSKQGLLTPAETARLKQALLPPKYQSEDFI